MCKFILMTLCSIMLMLLTGCGATSKGDLSDLMAVDKQQVVKQVGKPSTVIRDDKEQFEYEYNTGVSLIGSDSGVNSITLANNLVTKETSDIYKLSGVTLDSSFDENVKRLGTPDGLIPKGDRTMAIYLRDKSSFLVLITGVKNDKVSTVSIVPHSLMDDMLTLNAANYLDSTMKRINSGDTLTIRSKYITNESDDLYLISSNLELCTDGTTGIIKSVKITGKSMYDIFGITVGSPFDDLTKDIGSPYESIDNAVTNYQ